MSTKIIAFTGGMGSGKSTAITYLEDYTNTTARLVKFAQPLYDMQESIYRRINSVYQKPNDFKKDRKLLQWLGTDWGRETISNTLWVDLWKQEVNKWKYMWKSPLVVCDDVRFDNEAETVKSMGGIIIKLVSNSTQNRIDTSSGIPNHASEAGVSPNLVDFVVENNGTIKEFQEKLYNVFEQISGLTKK